MRTHTSTVVIPAILAAQVDRAVLVLKWMFMGRMPVRRDRINVLQSDFKRFHTDTIRYGRLRRELLLAGDDVLLERLTAVEQHMARGQYALAAEAVQWFQWEILEARVQGTISRNVAELLIDEAQLLCEDLWAYEPDVTTTRPNSRE